MNRLLESIFGLRAGERSTALLMALYHYLLLITFYLLKPVRDSLFLAERGAAELPFVFILTTAVIVPIASLHVRAGRSYNLNRLIDGVSLFLMADIVVLRWLVTMDAAWVSYLLYAWVSIYGVLVTSQFWLLANAVFTAAQAKRVFTLLSFGAILGAVTGGEITGLLVEEFGMNSHNLLWLAVGLLAVATGLVHWIWRRSRPWDVEEPAPAEDDSSALGLVTAFNTLRTSRHLWFVIGVIALTVVTTTVIDYQFKTMAYRAYPDEEALASFMGRFYGRVSLAALVVQFVVAPYLIRILGVGGALAFLPTALAVGVLGMLFAPGLVAATLMRGTEQSLKHSIDKTGRELLFVPIDLERKKRVKVFIDLFVDQGTQGVGGVLLLLLTIGLGFSVYQLSFVVLALIGVWALLAYRARQSYIDQFRRLLRQQEDFERAKVDDDEEEPLPKELDELIESLCARGEQETHAALNRLEQGEATVPIDALRCLLESQSPEVRAHAIRVLRKRSVSGLGEAVATYLTDPDPDVQLEAARYIYCNTEGDRLRRLKKGLAHSDARIRAAVVALIAEEGGPEERALISEDLLRKLVEREGVSLKERRVQVARLLGVIEAPYRNELLRRLLRDDDPDVVRQAIESAGQTEDRAFVLPLLRRLKEEQYEEDAREALAAYGTRILGMLYDHLTDDRVELRVRRRIPFILALQPCQEAVQVLLLSLGNVSLPVRHTVIKALSRLHAQDQDFRFDEESIERGIRTDAKHFAALGQILYLHARTPHESASAIPRERLVQLRAESLERVFRLLGLRYNQRDIYDAYLGITADDPAMRSSAVEFVDNLVDWRISRLLLPLLDDPEGTQAAKRAPSLFDLHLHSWPEALEYMLKTDDPRLEALALSGRDGAQPDELRALFGEEGEPAVQSS